MTEEEKALSGVLFQPNVPELSSLKNKAHALSQQFSALTESDPERNEIIREMLGAFGEGSFLQRPATFHAYRLINIDRQKKQQTPCQSNGICCFHFR